MQIDTVDGGRRADYFLCNCADAFMEDARLFVFETYCRIHTKIDIQMLATRLVHWTASPTRVKSLRLVGESGVRLSVRGE